MTLATLSFNSLAVDLFTILDKCAKTGIQQLANGQLCNLEAEALRTAASNYRANPTEENQAKNYASIKAINECSVKAHDICAKEFGDLVEVE